MATDQEDSASATSAGQVGAPAERASAPEAASGGDLADEEPRVSTRTTLLYGSGSAGAGAFFAMNNFVLPLFLTPLGAPPVLIGLLSSTRSFEGAVLQPLVGAWSDHTWTRLGRRRVFIVALVPVSMLFLVVTPFVPALRPLLARLGLPTVPAVLALAALAIFLFTLTFNAMYDPYLALLADVVPVGQRGTVNGVAQALGLAGQVGLVLIAIVTGNFVIIALATAAALGGFFLPTVLGIREPRRLHGVVAQRRHTWRDYADALRRDRQVQLYFAVQFFYWFGINAVTPYLTVYATREAHFTAQGAYLLVLALLLSSALFVWPAGVVSDHLGLKRVFFIGMLLMAGSAVTGIFVTAHVVLYAVLVVAGLGNALQTAASYPLLTRIVFPDQMGLYTGLNSTVTSVAAPLSALLAGATFTSLGYRFMFPFVAVMFLCSLVPLTFLRVERSLYARARLAAAAQP